MKCIQALLTFVALSSVSARALPADTSLAIREALPFFNGHVLDSREPKKGKAANGTTSAAKASKAAAKASKAAAASATVAARSAKRDLSSGDLSQVDSIVESLTGANPGFKRNALQFPTLASRKKHNGTATNAALTTGTAAAAAKASKKAAKAAAKASKAAAASATASAAVVKRDLDIFADLQSRKKHNGTATANTAATVTDAAALASKSAAKAAKKAAKSAAKAAAAQASATASAATVKRDLEIVADMERRRIRSIQTPELIEEEEDVADAAESLRRRSHA